MFDAAYAVAFGDLLNILKWAVIGSILLISLPPILRFLSSLWR